MEDEKTFLSILERIAIALEKLNENLTKIKDGPLSYLEGL